jgi:hypothetical protein
LTNNAQPIATLEPKVFKQNKRLADAERALQTKITKTGVRID